MSTATLSYVIPSSPMGNPANTQITVNLNLTLSDTVNSDGSQTVTGATGSYQVGSTVYNVTSIGPTGGGEGADNHFWVNSNSPTNSVVNFNGLNFVTNDPNADGNATGTPSGASPNVDFFFDPTGSFYAQDQAQGVSGDVHATNVTATVTCYAAGTSIRTPRGDVAVEDLRVGDLVVTASGAQRPIVWLGHSKVKSADYENPRVAWPIRVAAGAFGENRPSRDLFVSPAHSICVDCVGEVMIDAQRLVNGSTITREEVAEIDYWHVELETHDVLLANNLPAESYLAMGNREFFVEHEGLDRGSEFGEAEFCRPRGNDGPVLAAVRAQLEARALRLGYRHKTDADLRLLVDGAELAALQGDGLALFLLPRAAQDVRLVTSACIPADHICENEDTRRLGLCVHGLSLSDGRRLQEIALDDPRLDEAFFPLETADGRIWRWSKSEAVLPAALLEGFEGTHVALSIACDTTQQRGWTAPARAEQDEAVRPAPRLYAVG